MRTDSAWADRAFQTLRRAGYRGGGARSAVVELLGEQGGCIDAEGVAERLRSGDRRVGTASVYRALNLLCELGLLQRVAMGEGASRYELVRDDGGHHHHLVCATCGRTFAFEDPALEQAIHKLGRRVDFDVAAHDVTLHGTCAACSG